jgi:hypothetical protein
LLECSGSPGISFGVLVGVAIYLDDQSGRQAHEVDDVFAKHMLSPELDAAEPAVPQQPPDLALGVVSVVAEVSGALLHDRLPGIG